MQAIDLATIFAPLDPSKREIRVLQIEDTPGIVRCTIERVSLDAYTSEFLQYMQDGRNESLTVTDVTKLWLDKYRYGRRLDGVNQLDMSMPHWRTWNHQFPWHLLAPEMQISTDVSDPLLIFDFQMNSHKSELSVFRDHDPAELVYLEPRFVRGDFEALSYCWETEVKDHDIILNGQTVKITENLESALQKIKRLQEVRAGMRIWCDAICIDQENKAEKSQQVVFMREIFPCAFSTIVWLGPGGEESSMVIDFLIQDQYLQRHLQQYSWDRQAYAK